MLKTILATTGALCAFGGLLFVLALIQARYELRQARRKEHPMARRYCGDITIYLTYSDAIGAWFGGYHCAVVTPIAHVKLEVYNPPHMEHAVDSPEAFDSAAGAALTFADDVRSEEGDFIDVAGYARIGDGGWAVTRKPLPGSRHSLEARAKAAVATLLGRASC